MKQISRLLFADIDIGTFVLKDTNEDWLKRVMKDVWLVIGSCYTSLRNYHLCRLQQLDYLLKQCAGWTGKVEELKYCLDYYLRQDDDTCTVYTLLYITAIFEDAITNLYFMFGNRDVVLIRDMLNSDSILNVLGKEMVLLIELIMGNCKTLNVRNIVWHGFAITQEIPICLPAVIFLIVFQIGHLLQSRSITQIPKRQYCYTDIDLRLLDGSFPELRMNEKTFQFLLEQNHFIPSSYYPLWNQCYRFYTKQMYGSSMLMLLPQLEHLLRCMFVDVNGLPPRQKNAQHDELYVTLDEILSPQLIDNNKNRIYDVLGDAVIVMISDSFVYPTGLRIKDYISHGQLSLNNFSELLFRHIFGLTLCVISRSISNVHCLITCLSLESSTNTIEGGNEELKETVNAVIQTIELCIDRYQSIYHPSALLRTSLLNCATNLEKLNDTIERISSDQVDAEQNQTASLEFVDLSEFNGMVKERLNIQRDKDIMPEITRNVLQLKFNNVESLQYDSKFLLYGRRICHEINKSCDNLKILIEVKNEQWKIRNMRSRARNMYIKMLHMLPIFPLCLQNILFVIYFDLFQKHFRTTDKSENYELFKYLKKIQTNLENIVSYTSITSNNWDSIRLHINSLNTVVTQYYKYQNL